MAEQHPRTIADYRPLGIPFREMLNGALDSTIERVLNLDPADFRSESSVEFLPLYLLVTKAVLQRDVHDRILIDYPHALDLQSEFSKQEARDFLRSITTDKPENDLTGIGFSVALILDYLSRHPERAQDYLSPGSSLEQNLDYLRKRTGFPEGTSAIDDPDLRTNIPVKVWAGKQLVEAGLADPETRYCADPFSLAIRTTELLNQGRTVWISSAMPDQFGDFVYVGLHKQEKDPLYDPQPTSLEKIFYNMIKQVKIRKHSLFPSLLQDLPKEVLLSKLVHDPYISWFADQLQVYSEEAYQQGISALKVSRPDLFPKNLSAPLFRGISSLRNFYLDVLPQLLDIFSQYPQTMFKVFPQDEKHLSIGTVLCDLKEKPQDLSSLGPSFTFEMSSQEYTPRGNVAVDRHVTYYPYHNLIFGDPSSVKIFYDVVRQPMRDGGSFINRLDQLFQNTGVHSGAVEVMVEDKPGNGHKNIAFATDFNPITNPGRIGPQPRSAASLLKCLETATVVSPELEKELLQQELDFNQVLKGLEQDCGTDEFALDFIQGLRKRLLSDQRQVLSSPQDFLDLVLLDELKTRVAQEYANVAFVQEFVQGLRDKLQLKLRSVAIKRIDLLLHNYRSKLSIRDKTVIQEQDPNIPWLERPKYPRDVVQAQTEYERAYQTLSERYPKVQDLIV